MNIKALETKINDLKTKLTTSLHTVETRNNKRSKRNSRNSTLILLRVVKGDNTVTKDDLKFLKNQLIDVVKILAVIGLQAFHFSSAGIIAMNQLQENMDIQYFRHNQKKMLNKTITIISNTSNHHFKMYEKVTIIDLCETLQVDSLGQLYQCTNGKEKWFVYKRDMCTIKTKLKRILKNENV